MKILSINFGHDASFCIFSDGELVDFLEIERESRHKHHVGVNSAFLLNYLERTETSNAIDMVVLSATQLWGLHHSSDIQINYGYDDLHVPIIDDCENWNLDHFTFHNSQNASKYGTYFRTAEFKTTPSPIRIKWNSRFFRSLAFDAKAIANLHDFYADGAFKNALNCQRDFFLPLTFKLKGTKIPGFFINHHAAHAYYAAYYSKNKSLIVTHDGAHATSAFNSGGIYLSDPDCGVIPFANHRLTLGAIYDSVAWSMGLDAGKLMGLASYARPNRLIFPVIQQTNDSLYSLSTLQPDFVGRSILHSATDDLQVRVRALSKFSFKFENRELAAQAAANAQKLVQTLYVDNIGASCERIFDQLGDYRNTFMTGGFSLNCPTNVGISDAYPSLNFHPLPGVGDTGLALGGAVGIHYLLRNRIDFSHLSDPMSAAFPKSCFEYNDSDAHPQLKRVELANTDLSAFIADKLIQGKVVCLHRGRSEVGPRALGNRSIIAWAGNESVRDRINESKGRENWRPLAPICREGDFHHYFAGEPDKCRFMLTVSRVKSDLVPAVTHVDNTARVQVIDSNDTYLYSVLEHIKNRGLPPVIINTSFNFAGEPMVETFSDAANSFLKMRFDYLVTEIGVYEPALTCPTSLAA